MNTDEIQNNKVEDWPNLPPPTPTKCPHIYIVATIAFQENNQFMLSSNTKYLATIMYEYQLSYPY